MPPPSFFSDRYFKSCDNAPQVQLLRQLPCAAIRIANIEALAVKAFIFEDLLDADTSPRFLFFADSN